MSLLYKTMSARDDAYINSIKALAGYKFWMFGYHAAAWVKYNRLLQGSPLHQASPFKALVHQARAMLEASK